MQPAINFNNKMKDIGFEKNSDGNDINGSNIKKPIRMISFVEPLNPRTIIKRSALSLSDSMRQNSRVFLNQRLCYVSEEMLENNIIDITREQDLQVVLY